MRANHLDYYKYQAKARNVHNATDVQRTTLERTYLYDRIILPRLKTDSAGQIVEVACGHGSFLYWLKSRNFTNILGIDSSPEQVALAQSAGLNVIEAEINTWLENQPPESISTIIGIDLIEHLSKDDFVTFLLNSKRVLTKAGQLILRYPNGDSPLVGLNLFNDITHVWTYTSTAMRSISEMCKFQSAIFVDESSAAIRDHRWLKVPVCAISQFLLSKVWQAASREKIVYWSPHMWVFLQ